MSIDDKIVNENRVVDKRKNLINSILNPKMLFAIALVYGGIGIPLIFKTEPDFSIIFKEFGPWIIGIFAALVGGILMRVEMEKYIKIKREDRFVDVDENRGENISNIQLKMLRDIGRLKEHTSPITSEMIEEIIEKYAKAKKVNDTELFNSFENYFNDIRSVLIEQVHTADKKASILLDKGTSYSKIGIVLFIISIISWQIISAITGFKLQYIYGIVSCSLLFVFIEFLSAWFLKQYRHFIDTSTYHINVKSIFDKYMMSYLAIKSLGDKEADCNGKYQAMLNILHDEIKWPDTYLFKHADISFAKEALETMMQFAKAMKSEVKSK